MARNQLLLTVINTNFIYPPSDVDIALSRTTHPYTRTGNVIVCPTIADMIAVFGDIITQTSNTQPVGNTGYSLGAGTMLEDRGEDIVWRLPSGEMVVKWRLVKQLTPQLPEHVIPVPGNSPVNTIGYLTVFAAWPFLGRPDNNMDAVLTVRV